MARLAEGPPQPPSSTPVWDRLLEIAERTGLKFSEDECLPSDLYQKLQFISEFYYGERTVKNIEQVEFSLSYATSGKVLDNFNSFEACELIIKVVEMVNGEPLKKLKSYSMGDPSDGDLSFHPRRV